MNQQENPEDDGTDDDEMETRRQRKEFSKLELHAATANLAAMFEAVEWAKNQTPGRFGSSEIDLHKVDFWFFQKDSCDDEVARVEVLKALSKRLRPRLMRRLRVTICSEGHRGEIPNREITPVFAEGLEARAEDVTQEIAVLKEVFLDATGHFCRGFTSIAVDCSPSGRFTVNLSHDLTAHDDSYGCAESSADAAAQIASAAQCDHEGSWIATADIAVVVTETSEQYKGW